MDAEQIRIWGYSNFPIPYLDILKYELDEGITKKYTKESMKQFHFIPVDEVGHITTVAMFNPSLQKIRELEKSLNRVVRIFWIKESEFNFLVNMEGV
jgi:hypothetical protein